MIEKPENVRLCRKGDEEKLMEFVRAGHQESAIFTLSEKKVREHIEAAVNKTRPIFIGVIDAPDSDRIAASIAIIYNQWWYTEDWSLDEIWNNVRKEYRKSCYGQNLLNFAKWLSDKCSRTLQMGILTTHRLDAKERFYERKLPKMGSVFIYNLQHSHGPAVKGVI